MPMKFRVWGVGRILLLVCALGGTFLLFFGVALRVALRAREVQVPVLVGKTVNDASQSLGALGLTLKVDPARRADPLVPANQILQQDPAAGVAARAERSIRVWISAGPRTTTVPDLVGQTERTARLRMSRTASSSIPSRSSDRPRILPMRSCPRIPRPARKRSGPRCC